MGNGFFIHDNKTSFDRTEGITFGVCLIAVVSVVGVLGVLLCCKKCKCDNENSEEIKFIDGWHTVLSFVFPRLMEKKKNRTEEELLLIAGRQVPKIDYSAGKCTSSNVAVISTYIYLSVMGFLIGLWFIVILVEYIIYRKTTSCNDINVDDDNYVCFDLDNKWEIVNCRLSPDERSNNVFCYLYTISPSAFGIAFSVASLVSTIVSVSFYAAVYFSDEPCSRYGIIFIQIITIVGSATCVIILGPIYGKGIWGSFFFFFFDGLSPMRIFIFVLGLLSVLIGSCLPWCALQDEKPYKDVASNIEAGESTEDGNTERSRSTADDSAERPRPTADDSAERPRPTADDSAERCGSTAVDIYEESETEPMLAITGSTTPNITAPMNNRRSDRSLPV